MSRFTPQGPTNPSHQPTQDFSAGVGYNAYSSYSSYTPYAAPVTSYSASCSSADSSATMEHALNRIRVAADTLKQQKADATPPTSETTTTTKPTPTTAEAAQAQPSPATLTMVSKQHVSSKSATELACLIDIATPPLAESTVRPPVDVCLLLDRSGSMDGDPLKFAKLAVIDLIRKLNATDRVHLVAYGSKATIVFENKSKRDLTELCMLIDEIKTQGCTNISDALLLGFEVLCRSDAPSVATKRLFLLSDGQANEKLQHASQLSELTAAMANHSVSTSTFGFGGHFDEDVMKLIAQHGRGNFLFINDETSVSERIDKGLDILTSLIGRNARLMIEAVGDTVITSVQGVDNWSDGVLLGDICADDVRNVLVQCSVPPIDNDQQQVVLTCSLVYDVVAEEDSHEQARCAQVLTVTGSDDVQALLNVPLKVQVALTLAWAGQQSHEVAQKIRESAPHQNIVEQQEAIIARLKSLEDSDESGMLKLMRQRAEITLQDTKQKKTQAACKGASWAGYRGASVVHRKCF